MSGDLSHIACCADLSRDDALMAIRSRGGARELLEHLVAVSISVEDAVQVLGVLALLATEDASEWVDGKLEVELVGVGDSTTAETVTSIGGGLRERLLPRLKLNAAMVELVAAVERAPASIEPLYVWHGSGGRVKLVADSSGAKSIKPPPPIAIATDSLVESVRPLSSESVLPEAQPEAPGPLNALDDPLADLEQGWDS